MPAPIPPLPQIQGDPFIILDVYTHNSIRTGGAPMNSEYGDVDRLAELGAHVFQLAVTHYLYSKKPMLEAKGIELKRVEVLSDSQLGHWFTRYEMKNKMKFAHGAEDSVESPHEIRRFFNTWVGALYIRNGMPTVQRWINQLLDPDVEVGSPDPLPPSYYGQGQQTFGQQSFYQQSGGSSYPPAPDSPPPPLPGYGTSPAANNVAVTNLVTLALVNQTAAQKRTAILYQADQTGEAHQPTWTVRCILDGQEKGVGVARSQKLAKEEAARNAWVAMGWGPRG